MAPLQEIFMFDSKLYSSSFCVDSSIMILLLGSSIGGFVPSKTKTTHTH